MRVTLQVSLCILITAFLGVYGPAVYGGRETKEEKVDRLVQDGRRLMDEKQYAEAHKKFVEALAIIPDGTGSLYNGGLAAYLSGDFKEAIRLWERLVEIDPKDWEGHAKLVQAYQATGDRERRDRHRDTLFDLRRQGVDEELSKLKQYRRDQFEVEGKSVLVFESFALEGDHAVLYSFVVLKPGTAEEDYNISLGSDETTNKVAHELGEIGPNDRLFHLDGNYPDGSHRLFGMHKNAPPYETVRDKVVEILKNKEKPLSGSIPGGTQPAGGEDKKPPEPMKR
jgi:tetratricopeptide (TPR) repeat protein